jgi:hypothetical protein
MHSVIKFLLAFGAVFLAPQVANALVRIDIDLSTQTMHVVSGSGASYDWPVSTGRAGHLTPRGSFRPIALYPMVHSAKYNNAPMPHSIFFLSQYAIHGTTAVGMLGHQASHGCVRLSPANAATLYSMVQSEGAAIQITGVAPDSGFAVASHHSRRHASTALAYAPAHRARTLREWAKDPVHNN